MSLDNNLREQLSDVFSAIDPAAAPIEATIRQGKRVRWRRRAAAAAGLAVVAAAAICVPLAVHPLASPSPATNPARYTVTVQPPGPGSPAGEIAQGTVNGASWRLTAGQPTRQNGQLDVCIHMSGPAFGGTAGQVNCAPPDTDGMPASFGAASAGPVHMLWAPVESDVSYATVALTNGDLLKLRPVTVHGIRWIAFVVPDHAVRVVTAYSSRGEISSAVPFDGGGEYSFADWLKPGQHGPPPATVLIGSGTVDGTRWSVTLYAGPWGTCQVTSDGTSSCWASMTAAGHIAGTTGSAGPNANHTVTGMEPLSVARIVVALPGGGIERVRLVTVNGTKYWAFEYPKVLHWTAYDSAGQAVAHGST